MDKQIGTHWVGCWKSGRDHYGCAVGNVERLQKRLVEVRERVIFSYGLDYGLDSSPDSAHCRTCRLCGGIWSFGQAEQHEPGCPVEGLEVSEEGTNV